MGAWIETLTGLLTYLRPVVAPYVGAWIETVAALNKTQGALKSHPTWVRGLKLQKDNEAYWQDKVAPYVGAWIETRFNLVLKASIWVAPYVGAWIET